MNERTLSEQTVYEGRILSLRVLEVETARGVRAVREIVRHVGAVAVLAEREDGRFVFVRQFRKAVERVLLEVVAGLLKPGEEPAACARRELEEETGYRATELRNLGAVYPSPGYVTEKIDLFWARVELGPDRASPDEDEHLDVVVLTRKEVEDRIRRGEIQDAKTLAIWLLYEKMKPGLSGEGR